MALVFLMPLPAAAREELTIGEHERLLVVAPHPDDEALGAGGLIQRVVTRGGIARVVLLTAGDGFVEAVVHETGMPRPRPGRYIAYGERRMGESRAAMRVLAGHHARLQLLGFPDGGLRQLFYAHWQRRHPELSPFTGVLRPPYREAVDPGLAYDGTDLLRELLALLRDSQPTLVALPDPLDRHPDHRAGGLFTLLALADWLREGVPAPRVLAYLVHWPGWPPGWDAIPPAPPSTGTTPFELPETLPARPRGRFALALTDQEQAGKRAALACYTSQQEEMPGLLSAFVRATEPFTALPPPTRSDVTAMIEQLAGPTP